MEDFIVAIDLGTAHLTGVVGRRNANGSLHILSREAEDSSIGVRRGCIFNIEEAAAKVKSLVRRLEQHTQVGKIAKLYIGVGGQSVRSLNYTVAHDLGEEGEVTDGILDMLHEECHAFRPEGLEVLDIVSPSYLVDGKAVSNPVGIPCERVEAVFQLIVARPNVRKHILNSVADRAQLKLAGVTIAPLTLAEAVLTAHEKELGCALIGFGAGVTSVCVYKGGQLQSLCVIPLGAHLLTRDLTTLNLIETEAERVKLAYADALADRTDPITVTVSAADDNTTDLPLAEIHTVIEARTTEILENVFVQLEATGAVKTLGAGVVITGGGSGLRNLSELIRRRLGKEVRIATLRKGLLDEASEAYNTTENMTAISLLLLPDAENCAAHIPSTSAAGVNSTPQPLFTGDAAPEVKPAPAPPPPPVQKEGKVKRGFRDIIGELFSEDNI
jgi:cell division protein FtsA